MIRNRCSKLQMNISRETLRLYSFSLRDPTPGIVPKVEIDIVAYDRPLDLERLQRSTIEERIFQGDRIFVARHHSKPVAYLFAATKSCWVSEIDDRLIIGSNEVYLYDAFTNIEYRGNRIYPSLISNTARFFKELSYSYALIFTTSSNISSVKGIERAGFCCYQTIYFYNLFGRRIWNYKTRSRNVQSRFSNEN